MAAFLHDDLVAAAGIDTTYSTAPVSTMPLSNLIDPQPRMRCRWSGVSAGMRVDFGSSQTISAVALIGTTLTDAAASIRVRLSDVVDMTSPSWDTGTDNCDTSAAANGNVVILHATSASGRYLQVEVGDATATTIDIGRLVAGPLWRLSHSWAYGLGEGRTILDRRDRNSFTGAEFPVPAVFNPRAATFQLQYVTAAEAIGEWRTMLATLGGTGDALWVPEETLSQSETNLRAIWGSIAQPGESAFLTRANFLQYQRQFTMVERV